MLSLACKRMCLPISQIELPFKTSTICLSLASLETSLWYTQLSMETVWAYFADVSTFHSHVAQTVGVHATKVCLPPCPIALPSFELPHYCWVRQWPPFDFPIKRSLSLICLARQYTEKQRLSLAKENACSTPPAARRSSLPAVRSCLGDRPVCLLMSIGFIDILYWRWISRTKMGWIPINLQSKTQKIAVCI